ncbi:MAG: M20/M25/M40 family metallo-hydrolase [Actinobacteria bacterium]|nr:M20/M25/M40 family metallo-hydrolase [Actinomycetota bacterium]
MQYLTELQNWINKNKDDILSTLSQLIQIPTENLPPSGNEKPGQEYLYNKVSKFIPDKDIDVFEVEEVSGIEEHPLFFPTMENMKKIYKNRPNLVARLRGTGGGSSICFSGHIDTMPAGKEKWNVFTNPFSGEIKDGKIYGRGSLDMKAGTLAGFYALKCLKDLKVDLKGNVYAESVVDEENGGVNGTIAARLRYPDINFAILAEPTDLAVGIETIGGSDWKVEVIEKGPGGIGTDIELPNPIYKLAKVALALQKYDKEVLGRIEPPSTFSRDMRLRLLTYQFSSGGSTYLESGSVPIKGHMYFWLEAFEYMSENYVREKFMEFMRNELAIYDDFKDSFPKFERVIRFLYGHKTNTNHPAMTSIRNAYKDLGLQCKEQGIPLAMDAFAFKEVSNTEVVVIGPSGKNPHGIDEYVDIDSFLNLIKIMVLTAIDYCS